jgi:hypothetical protein
MLFWLFHHFIETIFGCQNFKKSLNFEAISNKFFIKIIFEIQFFEKNAILTMFLSSIMCVYVI